MLVGAAGILTEVFLAAVAMLVWVAVEPGLVRALAFNVMLIAGVSTLLFNGNPLLRFDAYYVLADFIEIPNLASRANRQLGYLLKRYLLGMDKEESPALSIGEGAWLAFYAVASFVYRMVVMLGIALFVAAKLFVLGAILALWSFYGFLLQPALKTGHYLLTDPQMQEQHPRILLLGLVGTLLAGLLLFALPVSRGTVAEGVLWAPEQNRVIAALRGRVDGLLVEPGARVTVGTPLIGTSDPELDARFKVVEARIGELQARQRVARSQNQNVEAGLVNEEIVQSRQELAHLAEKRDALLIRSPADGVFQLMRGDDLTGRFLQRGELLGYVLEPGAYLARVLVGQADIDAVRNDTRDIQVRLAEDTDRVSGRTGT